MGWSRLGLKAIAYMNANERRFGLEEKIGKFTLLILMCIPVVILDPNFSLDWLDVTVS